MTDSRQRDKELFRAAMREVRRLPATPLRPEAPKPVPKARFTRSDQRAVLQESLLPPADNVDLGTGEELSFRRPQVPQTVLQKLRRGHYTVDAEIDLHGLSGAQAKQALRDFLATATLHRMSCVRIIHGKGKRSGPRGPVLKHVVNRWLQLADVVLAFATARSVDGGSGAVYVLLQPRS